MIRIQNVYHMLSYAFQILNAQGYKDVATEEFENTAELCAAILIRGTTLQLKRGLGREYRPRTETLSGIRGKMDISSSLKSQAFLKKQMVCTYDEFTVDSYMNRILKSTLMLLLRIGISPRQKKEIRKLLVFFAEVEPVNLYAVDWHLRYDRNNQTYRMLMAVCWLLVKGLLQTQADGSVKLMDFFDEARMSRLYEKFILEYYRKECPQLEASASQIPWVLDDGPGIMLPIMQSDIMLSDKAHDRVLIIDAKYYSDTTQARFDAHTLHSGNLYQIFTYVKNKAEALRRERPGRAHSVSGMLLYARTDDAIQPACTYQMSGNQISARTLNLNVDFHVIADQLKQIAAAHFPECVGSFTNQRFNPPTPTQRRQKCTGQSLAT